MTIRSIVAMAGMAIAIGSVAAPALADNPLDSWTYNYQHSIAPPSAARSDNRIMISQNRLDNFEAQRRVPDYRIYASRKNSDMTRYASRSDVRYYR